MTKTMVRKAMLALPVQDRIDLLDVLNISIQRDQDKLPVYPWQKKLIRERLKDLRENPGKTITFEKFKKKMDALRLRYEKRALKKMLQTPKTSSPSRSPK